MLRKDKTTLKNGYFAGQIWRFWPLLDLCLFHGMAQTLGFGWFRRENLVKHDEYDPFNSPCAPFNSLYDRENTVLAYSRGGERLGHGGSLPPLTTTYSPMTIPPCFTETFSGCTESWTDHSGGCCVGVGNFVVWGVKGVFGMV